MLDYNYFGKGCQVGGEGHIHRVIIVTNEVGELVSNALEVTYPGGDKVTIRFFNYIRKYRE